jgi:riboflavin transporter FmnP
VEKRLGKLDSVSLGGIAVFGALSVLLTILSQAMGLNFPLIPYLQFDFGEVAILLSFFIFGPVAAVTSSFIEFVTLMGIGQNAAAFGPELKFIAIISSLLGVWLGTVLTARMARPSVGKAVALGAGLGVVFRSAIMTVPNYVLIIFLYSLPGIVGFVSASFKLVGVTLTDANALVLVLGFTAVFNALQLIMVSVVTYLLFRLPQIRSTRAAGRRPWLLSYLEGRRRLTSARQASPGEAPPGS